MDAETLGAYIAFATLVAIGTVGVAISLRECKRHEEPVKTLVRTLCESFVIFNFGTALGIVLTLNYSPGFWIVMATSATLGYLLLAVSALRVIRKMKVTKEKCKRPLSAPHAILIERPGEGMKLLQALHRYTRVPILVITREPPEEWENRTGIKPEKFIWLSRVKTENSVDPLHLHIITEEVARFLRENPAGIVYIDGVEYLLFYNDFSSLAKFLISVKDIAILYGGHVIVSVIPDGLKKSELSILRREFERVDVEAILKDILGPALFGAVPPKGRVKDASDKGAEGKGGTGEEEAKETQPLRREEKTEEGR
jgi:hypothetical protein